MHTVILVDDEVYVRKGLRNVINWKRFGYEVIDEADNGEDALEMIGRMKPDVVITDIRMPVLDGLELIERSQQHNPNTNFIILSGYSDFNYAKQAVRFGIHDFLLKPVDEEELAAALSRLHPKLLQNKLLAHNNSNWLKESMIDALIRGEVDDALAASYAKELGIVEGAVMYYALIEVNDVPLWNRRTHSPAREWKKQMKAAIRETGMEREDGQILLKEHGNGRFGFLISIGHGNVLPGGIEAVARQLQKEFTKRIGGVVYLYIGKPAEDIGSLKESYLTANQALQYKFARKNDPVILYSQIQDDFVQYTFVQEVFFRKFAEQIEEHNTAEILRLVDELFHEFYSKRFAPEAVKSALNQGVHTVLTLIRSMEGDERELTALDRMLNWQNLNISPDELKRRFSDFALESAQLIAKRRKDHANGVISKIKAYIEERYHENISLKSIASIFYMNPVYLGQLFKRTYGLYFNDYLLRLRISEAKKLLRQTDCRIYEISEKVGFSNADYFVSQFQKLEKMTPTEYRNKLLSKGTG